MQDGPGVGHSSVFTLREAMEIEQEAHRVEQQRKKELEEKQEERRRRMGLPIRGERALTREEQEARVYAFMCAGYYLSAKITVLIILSLRSQVIQPNRIRSRRRR